MVLESAMFLKHANHVSKELSAYCNGELSADAARHVAEHLIGCNRCRPEFEEIRLGVRLAEQLPIVPAPDSLWTDLELLMSTPAAGVATHAARRVWGPPRLRFVALAAVVVLTVGLGVFWFYPREAKPSWEVARIGGTPRIGARGMNEKGRLGLGQWLETDSDSRAQIAVGGIGQVEIDPNTSVRLVETKPTEHRLELARGKMSAHIWAPPKLFFVDTPSGVAEDLGCAYTLEVDDHGASLLRVTTGWVALQLKDRESMVPAGAACATRRGIGPGTPYFEDASESFRAALTRVDFGPEEIKGNMMPLEIVLATARVRDSLTLWHLLARVEGADRALVYDRLALLVPPPAGVTRAGVLALNQQMLDTWKETLAARWYDTSSPVLKVWRKV
jgi:anti-sigma factor RsiW